VLAFDAAAADADATIVAHVGYSRRKLLDRMIAGHALVKRATFATTNADDFRDIAGLEMLAW
jgi:predicted nucleic acid-binding protein